MSQPSECNGKSEPENVLTELRQRYFQHTSGQVPLAPEQSLALRSHISGLADALHPAEKQMWPEHTSAEKDYLEEQAQKHAKQQNHIAAAVVGALAIPAVAAEMADAPPETVHDLLKVCVELASVHEIQTNRPHVKGRKGNPIHPAENTPEWYQPGGTSAEEVIQRAIERSQNGVAER